MIDGSHVPRGEVWVEGAHQTAETADMARLAEPPALPLLPQGYPLTISCPASAHRSLCADTARTLVSHGFYLKLDVCKHFDGEVKSLRLLLEHHRTLFRRTVVNGKRETYDHI